MVTHARQPGVAHQVLVDRAHALLGEFSGMPKIEQIAILSQIIGHLVAELPAGSYGTGEVMQAVSLNIVAGNQQTARSVEGAIRGVA